MSAHAQGMPCPNDGTPLVMSERQGFEIDYCPSCRGVWLDRGELDKIVERLAAPASAPAPQQVAPPYPQHLSGGGYYKQKRRQSFLEELFD
ncbi:zf-TFIIB domain-containing protein [Sphingomonas flavescens]|uniref:TFIIB-type zinc ribbon-containing protein n=1 Tax=Sphingomonas flavescens TaxID=3132797 RepID=UPI002804C852|nr:zf-TFIIB domain-containing protein [Sphingomonas limnosediminicola]